MRSVRARAVCATFLFVAMIGVACTTTHADRTNGHKVLVLGIDGMDPDLLDGFMAEGKLPNFARLTETGSYKRLTTSLPPQSPVAWSSIITGMEPGGHGIFDFIHRDPETMLPYLSTSRVEAPSRTVTLGNWVIPLSSGSAELLRRGKAFWEVLSENGVPSTVFKMPANFPPTVSEARTFAGMGTPDILGTYGTFSFYTDEPPYNADEIAGGRVYPVYVEDDRVDAEIVGPPNSFRKDQAPATVGFTVWLDAVEPAAKFDVQGNEFILAEGEWSDWIPLEFELIPYMQSVRGMSRFYLKRVRPEFELYVSPVNLDPAAPALPLSTPEGYSAELAEAVGRFHTLGIAEDTKALTAGVLTDGEYLSQARTVFDEQLRVFEYEMARFESGLLFAYFSGLDQNAHMFWRAMDPDHPAYEAEAAELYSDLLERYYREMDAVLGRVLDQIDDDTTLIILSDHGFAPYRRSFNLNNWLADNGYLYLKDDSAGADANLFVAADWSRTRVYGLGLNGLYLNLHGRERDGVVEPGAEADALLTEISARLLEIVDPKTGEAVMTRVDRADEVYSGEYSDEAPDLLIGYNRGYRAGWRTILGEFAWEVLEDNTEPWSGDHCMDYRLVPGVVLSNRKIVLEVPGLTNIAPTLLAEFGIEKAEGMTGAALFGDSN